MVAVLVQKLWCMRVWVAPAALSHARQLRVCPYVTTAPLCIPGAWGLLVGLLAGLPWWPVGVLRLNSWFGCAVESSLCDQVVICNGAG